MYLENMDSLADPEKPELLTNYLIALFKQLEKNSSLFSGMVDQLAMAITRGVRIDSKKLALIDLNHEPEWDDVKPCIGVHPDARTTITEIMEHSEQDLKIAVLLIHFYNTYDPTPMKEDIEDESDDNDYDSDSYNDDY